MTEYDGSGNVTAKYIQNLAVDDPLAVQQGESTYYYHKDGLGNVTDLTDSAGTVIKRYKYLGFGEVYSETGALVQPYAFTGRENDPETGLYYYRARYYDPKAGRFISKDPIGFDGGDTNLYRYVQNNPVNMIDPEGLSPLGLIKKALLKVHKHVRGSLPKGKPGKFGSPQRGTPEKGYRLDPAHPDASPGSPESYPHINWWDYTKGKRGKGGHDGAEPIIGGILGFLGSLLDPFDAISGELAGPEDDMIFLDNPCQ